MKCEKRELSLKEREELFATLSDRFANNMDRHMGLKWPDIHAKLVQNPDKL